MSSRDKKLEDLMIAESVIANISNDKLKAAHEFFKKYSTFKKYLKLYSTYIEGAEDCLNNTKNSRMYVNYNIDGTVTGRLSNSGATLKKGDKKQKLGISFHTLPREIPDVNIRDYVIAPPGHKFITIDMKAMELRVLAHVANERNMIKAFESGEDLHYYSASMTFSKPISQITKEERQIAKEVSFLTVYGGNEITLSNRRNISEIKAKKIIDAWLDSFPGVREYMKTIREYIEQFGYAKTIFGRYRNLPNIKSPVRSMREEAFRQGLNFTVQSPASDILCCGLIGATDRLKAKKMKSKIVATVHDSIEAIAPDNEVEDTIKILSDELINYPYLKKNFNIYLRTPMEIDIEVGTSFGNGERYVLS